MGHLWNTSATWSLCASACSAPNRNTDFFHWNPFFMPGRLAVERDTPTEHRRSVAKRELPAQHRYELFSRNALVGASTNWADVSFLARCFPPRSLDAIRAQRISAPCFSRDREHHALVLVTSATAVLSGCGAGLLALHFPALRALFARFIFSWHEQQRPPVYDGLPHTEHGISACAARYRFTFSACVRGT